MKITLRLNPSVVQAQLRRLGKQLGIQQHAALNRALQQEAGQLRQAVRAQVAGRLKVVRRSFLKTFTAKVLDRDPSRLPALYVGARLPWSGMHEQGGTLTGRMLIPLHGRVGRKRFKAQVDALMRGGNAWFVRTARGHLVLMAENLREHDRPLAGFKRRYRQAAGLRRLKRGSDIPIAVLVPRVVLRKRLDLLGLVHERLPRLLAGLAQQLHRLR